MKKSSTYWEKILWELHNQQRNKVRNTQITQKLNKKILENYSQNNLMK